MKARRNRRRPRRNQKSSRRLPVMEILEDRRMLSLGNGGGSKSAEPICVCSPDLGSGDVTSTTKLLSGVNSPLNYFGSGIGRPIGGGGGGGGSPPAGGVAPSKNLVIASDLVIPGDITFPIQEAVTITTDWLLTDLGTNNLNWGDAETTVVDLPSGASPWTTNPQTAAAFDISELETGTYEYHVRTTVGNNEPDFITDVYSIQNRTDSEFGEGWWLDDYKFLVEQSTGVTMIQDGGAATWFAKSGNKYTTPDGLHGELSKVPADAQHPEHFHWRDDFGNEMRFLELLGTETERWLRYESIDPQGNSTFFHFGDEDGDGLHDELVGITDPFGRTSTYTYQGVPGTNNLVRLHEITDLYGRVTTFTYNPAGQLTRVDYPQIPVGGPGATQWFRPSTSYEYDDLLTAVIDNAETEFEKREDIASGYGGRLQSRTSATDSTTNYYPARGQGLFDPHQSGSNDYQHMDRTGSTTDARGYRTEFEANAFGQITQLTDAAGNEFFWEYNEHGQLTSEAESVDGVNATTHYTYKAVDADPLDPDEAYLYRIEYADGAFEAWSGFNAKGLPKMHVVGTNGNPERSVRYGYDPNHPAQLTSVTYIVGQDDTQVHGEADDITWSYAYTTGGDNLPLGLLRFVTDPLGRQTEYQYYTDSTDLVMYGRLHKIIQPAIEEQSAETVYDYAVQKNANGVFEEWVTTVQEEGNRVTEQYWNAADDLIRTRQPLVDPSNSASARPVTSYFYDGNYDLTHVQDAEGSVTEYVLENGRLAQIKEQDPDEATGGPLKQPITSFWYDAADNLVATVDPLDRMTSYQYDPAGRAFAVIGPDVDGQVARPLQNPVWAADINADGVVDQRDVTAIKTFLAEQPNGTFTLPTTLTASQHPVELGLHYYDVDGNGTVDDADIPLTADFGTIGELDYSDKLGRPITLSWFDGAGNITSLVDAEGRRTDFGYDLRGRQDEILAPLDIHGDRPRTRLDYNASNQPIRREELLKAPPRKSGSPNGFTTTWGGLSPRFSRRRVPRRCPSGRMRKIPSTWTETVWLRTTTVTPWWPLLTIRPDHRVRVTKRSMNCRGTPITSES